MFDKSPFEGVDEEIAKDIKKEAQENLKLCFVKTENGLWTMSVCVLKE